MEPQFSVEEAPGNGNILVLVGEVELGTVDILRVALDGRDVNGPLVLDLERVTFVDSTGIGVLLRAHETFARAGSTLTLRHVPRMVRSLFETVGIAGTFHVED